MVQGHSISDIETPHPGTSANNNTRRLVAEDSRGRQGAVFDFFDVRGADAAGGDFYEEFTRADAGNRDCLDAEIVSAAINHRAHSPANRTNRTHCGTMF
jgi:hypothetical protein